LTFANTDVQRKTINFVMMDSEFSLLNYS